MTERRMPATITEYCPNCRKMVAAALLYEYNENSTMITDMSTCPCGLVLWEFRLGQGIKFAPKGFAYQTKDKEKDLKGQMRLF